MTDIVDTRFDDRRARRNVSVLVMAQAFLGAQMAMIFIVGGLAGQSLASNICFATLPISLIVVGSMVSANPTPIALHHHGQRI
ncbi:MAG: MFS transporter, partial [Pseudomonadota bacterium]